MEISSLSRITLIPSGARDFFNVDTAFSSSPSVDPHLGHVSPLDINLFHLIFKTFDDFSSVPGGEQLHLFLLLLISVIEFIAGLG